MAASRLMPALVLLLAVPATAAETATFWANVDSDFNYWMDAATPGQPAFAFPGRFCTVQGEGPAPCAAAADPVVWDLPLRLEGPVTLADTGNVAMAAFLNVAVCDGCGPTTVARLEVSASLVQGNTTLLDAGPLTVTILGAATNATWSVAANGAVLDPAAGNVSWRLRVQPVAGAAAQVFLGMAEGNWSMLRLPVVVPEPVVTAAPPATVTATTTRTSTQSLTSTATVTHTWTRMVAERVAADDAAAQGLPAGGLVLTAALLVAAAAFRARLR